jgi:hypothetical protein
MLQRIRQDRPSREGATLERVRLNETITQTAFGGGRRGVYARIAARERRNPRAA